LNNACRKRAKRAVNQKNMYCSKSDMNEYRVRIEEVILFKIKLRDKLLCSERLNE